MMKDDEALIRHWHGLLSHSLSVMAPSLAFKNVFYKDGTPPPPLTLLSAEVDLRFEPLNFSLSLAADDILKVCISRG